jgi:CHAT domain-containing protein/tetratricopeptide (TPR) repeat protein
VNYFQFQCKNRLSLRSDTVERKGISLVLMLALSLSLSSYGSAGAAPGDTKGSAQQDRSVVKELEEALAGARKGKPDAQAKALYNLGKALGEERRFAEAEGYLKEALALDRQSGKKSDIFEDLLCIAMIQGYAKNFDAAEATYQEGLAEAKASSNDHWTVRLSNNLGALYIHNQQYEKAEKYYQQARDVASKSSDFVGEAQARLNLGLIYEHQGQSEKGLAEAVAAQKLLGADPDNQFLAGQIALNMANLKEHSGDIDGAQADYSTAAKYFEGSGDGERQGSALIAIGNQHLMRGQTKEASAAFANAAEIFRREENDVKLASALAREGAALADSGKYSAAVKLHIEAANIAAKAGSADQYIDALYELAFDYYLSNNTDTALNKFVEVSLKLKEGTKVKDKDALADCYLSIALCYRALGQVEAAKQFYTKAAEIYRANQNKVGEAAAEDAIGCLYLDNAATSGGGYLAQYKKVQAILASASSAEKSSTDYKKRMGYVDYNHGQNLVLQDQYEEANSSYENALAAFTAVGDRKNQARVYIGLGLSKLIEGGKTNSRTALEQAITYYRKAATMAAAASLAESEWDAAIGEGAALKQLGDKAKAEEKLRQAIALFEKEKTQSSRDDAKTFALDLRSHAFELMIDLLVEQKRFDDALEIAERGRARAFLDLLEGRQKSAYGTAVVNGAGMPAQAPGQSPVKAPEGTTASNENVIAMGNSTMRGVQILPKAGSALSPSVIDSEHNLALDTALSPVNAQAPDLKELKTLVTASNSYILEYFINRDKLFIWLVNPSGTVDACTTVAIEKGKLQKLVTAAYQAIITPPKSIANLAQSNQVRQQNLIELHKILIAPIEDKLPKGADQVITIVPHAELFKVPFAALTDPEGKLFIEKHTLAVVPSIGVFRATQRLASSPDVTSKEKDSLLAFGNPTIKLVSALGALPYAEREVKKIADIFGNDRSVVKIGADATKANLRELVAKSSVIHLATHGLIDEDRPMDSAVLLATTGTDDGILSVKDILQLPSLKARLVTLSACQTGRGKITGDGVAGLSRAFIIAGTPSVLVSLWNVDDVMTEFQMEEFYRQYLTGAHKARALRDAQLKTIAFMEKGTVAVAGAAKVRANPRYWAAFQLVGNSQ